MWCNQLVVINKWHLICFDHVVADSVPGSHFVTDCAHGSHLWLCPFCVNKKSWLPVEWFERCTSALNVGRGVLGTAVDGAEGSPVNPFKLRGELGLWAWKLLIAGLYKMLSQSSLPSKQKLSMYFSDFPQETQNCLLSNWTDVPDS